MRYFFRSVTLKDDKRRRIERFSEICAHAGPFAKTLMIDGLGPQASYIHFILSSCTNLKTLALYWTPEYDLSARAPAPVFPQEPPFQLQTFLLWNWGPDKEGLVEFVKTHRRSLVQLGIQVGHQELDCAFLQLRIFCGRTKQLASLLRSSTSIRCYDATFRSSGLNVIARSIRALRLCRPSAALHHLSTNFPDMQFVEIRDVSAPVW